jgi:hypothetical protein
MYTKRIKLYSGKLPAFPAPGIICQAPIHRFKS